ncbi:MAG TPA: Zn-dependent hydrolase [Vicinamibacterales bacterium]|nr:Zn-dependent hydrolase [Vicinamibacterales bacterium]
MLTRRAFLATSAAVLGAHALGGPRLRAASPGPRVNPSRLRSELQGLSVFGRPPGGTFADGVSRVGFSDADVEGRRYVMSLMRAAGLQPRIDPAGNIFARRPGGDASLAPILFGSHIDSVPNGGNFDGDLGSLAALEAIRILDEQKIATRRPLEIVVWANEEGVAYGNGLCGSRAVAGLLEAGELQHVWNGVIKSDAIRKIGGDPDRIDTAHREAGSIHGYFELHIEQGGTLERGGISVGVVEGIVAIDRYEATVRGFANHAGTTPMPERKDALVAASHLAIAVREIVVREPGRQVGTVGQLVVTPNAPNVIPGSVRLTIELRDLSIEKISRLAEEIERRAAQIAQGTGTTIEIARTSRHHGALAAPSMQEIVARAADDLGLSHVRMPSGAGHDAQSMAKLAPMGMVFVPSVGGISHSPKELTTWEDCARGADVLLRAVLLADAAPSLS